MRSLDLATAWPVDHLSIAVIERSLDSSSPAGTHLLGDPDRVYRLASVAKPITAWAALIAVEEGLIHLDTPVGQPGCTLRHLLAHAGGYAFDGDEPITRPERRRIYSNTGIELAAAAVEAAAEMPFADLPHRRPSSSRWAWSRPSCGVHPPTGCGAPSATCAGSSTS